MWTSIVSVLLQALIGWFTKPKVSPREKELENDVEAVKAVAATFAEPDKSGDAVDGWLRDHTRH